MLKFYLQHNILFHLGLDSSGFPPTFMPGDRIKFLPWENAKTSEFGTVIKQTMSFDSGNRFWGNVELDMDDNVRMTANSWQIRKIEENK